MFSKIAEVVSKEPNIIFVLNRIGAGGAETQVRHVSTGLGARGWNVTIISLSEDTVPSNQCPDLARRVNFRARSGWRTIFLLSRLQSEMRALAPAVCIGLMIPADPIARLASQLSRTPMISSLRNELVGGWPVNLSLLLTSWIPIHTTTNTARVKETLGPKVSPWWRQIQVIPNTVQIPTYPDEERERCEVRGALQIAENEFLWLAVGAQTEQKNYLGLIEAFKTVPDSRLIIVGADYQRDLICRTLADLGLTGRVRQLGRRHDVARILLAADGFVQASHYEGMPNAVMEAMAARKAIVATDVGGVSELIRQGITGILVPPKSPSDLAQAMREVQDMSANDREGFGTRAKALVERCCSTDRVLDQWEEVIRSAWSKHEHASS